MAAGLAGTAVGAGAVSQPARAAAHKTNAHIVIAGAGAAGLAVANRLAEQLDGAKITLIDARKPHYYQPGFTLVAAGLKPASYVTSTTSSYVPNGVTLIEDRVAAFDPDANKVVTATGQSLSYDYLVVTTGMILDFDAIEGMELDKVGQNGLGALYAGPQYAAATWKAMSKFADEGGRGLFLRPATEMKCAGAPLKYTFLTDSHLRRRGNRGKAELVYAAHSASLFSVPIVNEKVRMLFLDRGVTTLHHHVLTGIDPGAKRATFQTDGGSETIDYDFINVIPPMRAPAAVRNSPLAWQEGKFAADGWMEVDKPTLRHKRYPNVFGVGDVAGVPKGKTAASVKWQVPVAVDHLVADITGTASSAAYNGYTSCPLITQLGRAMLVEFDYNNNLVPSFPGVIAPLEELWVTWVMKTMALKPTYISMLRGAA
ncbi:MAG: NAD(P)/FAD-dependent oxidoreductase [Rhodospirillaceae bacterium]